MEIFINTSEQTGHRCITCPHCKQSMDIQFQKNPEIYNVICPHCKNRFILHILPWEQSRAKDPVKKIRFLFLIIHIIWLVIGCIQAFVFYESLWDDSVYLKTFIISAAWNIIWSIRFLKETKKIRYGNEEIPPIFADLKQNAIIAAIINVLFGAAVGVVLCVLEICLAGYVRKHTECFYILDYTGSKPQRFCPHCGNVFQNDIQFCPDCGAPLKEPIIDATAFGERSVSKGNNKNKYIFTIIIALALLVGSWLVYSNVTKINTYNRFADLYNTLTDGAIKAETANRLVISVWKNSIYKTEDIKTDKYTKEYHGGGNFYDDFNDSIASLYSDQDFIDDLAEIRNTQIKAEALLKELAKHPDSFDEEYSDFKELYNLFLKFTNMSIDLRGSLNTFTNDHNELDNEIADKISEINIYFD